MTSEEQLAHACADSMWSTDQASQGLGMEIEEIRTGYARLSMTIEPRMTNGQRIAHGGFIFTLADSAFAFACNTYNQLTVAQHCSISFLAPGAEGDRLTAIAQEQHKAGRSGLYDVMVHNQNGDLIAAFRGHSRMVPGQHIEDAGG
ncbi:MAG: hydroxyphenylacetyl-CoA thioesterase PaaI [Pseudomonadota bacterium]